MSSQIQCFPSIVFSMAYFENNMTLVDFLCSFFIVVTKMSPNFSAVYRGSIILSSQGLAGLTNANANASEAPLCFTTSQFDSLWNSPTVQYHGVV